MIMKELDPSHPDNDETSLRNRSCNHRGEPMTQLLRPLRSAAAIEASDLIPLEFNSSMGVAFASVERMRSPLCDHHSYKFHSASALTHCSW